MSLKCLFSFGQNLEKMMLARTKLVYEIKTLLVFFCLFVFFFLSSRKKTLYFIIIIIIIIIGKDKVKKIMQTIFSTQTGFRTVIIQRNALTETGKIPILLRVNRFSLSLSCF